MLKYFIDKVHRDSFTLFPRPRVIIGIPSDVTEVEKRAVIDATMNAGARQAFLIDERWRGDWRPSASPGRGGKYGSLTSAAARLTSRSFFGRRRRFPESADRRDEMNEDIIRYCRDEFNLLIGEKSAEDVKSQSAALRPERKECRCRSAAVISFPACQGSDDQRRTGPRRFVSLDPDHRQ